MISMSPFFSIIIPVYNVAPYLRECLDSVLAQTFTGWEAICVDDGSTDGSGSILNEYKEKDERFKIIHKSNGGVSSARNRGLEHVAGKWVWFVDADDAIHPKALDFLFGLASMSNGVKTISFTTQRESQLTFGKWEPLPEVSSCIMSNRIDSLSLRMHRRGACTTIIRSEIAKKFSFQSYIIGEDVLYHFNVLWTYPESCLLGAPIYFYRQRSGSAVNGRITKKKVEDMLDTEYEMLKLYQKYSWRCRAEDVKEYYRWNEDFVWNTCVGMFFRLPLREENELLSKWIRLQKMQHKVLSPALYKKFVMLVLGIVPSATICKLLVKGPRLLNRLLKTI